MAEVIPIGVLLITDANIAEWVVLWHLNAILKVNLVLKTAKTVKALFSFHLIKYKECYFSLMAGLLKFYFRPIQGHNCFDICVIIYALRNFH